jgi:hypothetical protein
MPNRNGNSPALRSSGPIRRSFVRTGPPRGTCIRSRDAWDETYRPHLTAVVDMRVSSRGETVSDQGPKNPCRLVLPIVAPSGDAGVGAGRCPAITIETGKSAVKTLLAGSGKQRRPMDHGSVRRARRPGRPLRPPRPPGSLKPPGQSDPQVSGVSRGGLRDSPTEF